ncbi:hypothetical protein KC19_4G266300 [Ceratodon purpureus]|uniref:Uncharacterized protein n=1 Tax=Ceratodon purpureus TaxID=3225 RepID=A0A8T0IFD6_CERPU|nr:hypothetical protein KC19_4G266300 [Ceratodon purpureus]
MATPPDSVADALMQPTAPRSRSREGEPLQQYYIAVDRQQYKMETVVDLLLVLGRRASLPVAICCSARDSLDAVCARVSASQQFSLLFLHSDQGDSERAETLSRFHAIVGDWNHSPAKSSVLEVEGDGVEKVEPKKSGLLVTTDACLPSATLGEPSLGARVLIHFDLPTKKEAYLRRLAACLTSAPPVVGHTAIFGGIAGGIVISVVVGGEVGLLRSIEEGCGVVIDEMPIHISELL